MESEIEEVQRQPCGCKVTKYKDEAVMDRYEPCLACALANAGIMLQEAAKRLHEDRHSQQPKGPAKDHIDGDRK